MRHGCVSFFSAHYLLSEGVVLAPHGDELAEMVRAEDGGVPGEVVEAVHDDGDDDVEHDEGAEEDEADEVGDGQVVAARLLGRVGQLGRRVVLDGQRVARPPRHARVHDLGPRLARRSPVKEEGRKGRRLKRYQIFPQNPF